MQRRVGFEGAKGASTKYDRMYDLTHRGNILIQRNLLSDEGATPNVIGLGRGSLDLGARLGPLHK
jgi:hypothetical protein